MAKLIVNGKEMSWEDGQMPGTLAKLLEELGIEAATVVAEVDGQIIERKKFSETEPADGQRIELVRFVGGG